MTIPSARSRRVVLVVPDLLFATRIAETAKRLGIEALASSRAAATASCRMAPTDLLIVDLEATDDVAGLCAELESDPRTTGVSVVAFYPHVRTELRSAALSAGVDRVLPRSAFVARMTQLLSGEGGTAE
jgi:CheY-like chemotaxis protein